MRGHLVLVSAVLASAIGIGPASATSSGGFNIIIESGSGSASCRGAFAAFTALRDDGDPGRGTESKATATSGPGNYQQMAVAPFVGPGVNADSEQCPAPFPDPGSQN